MTQKSSSSTMGGAGGGSNSGEEPVPLSLNLTFDDIANADLLVGDAGSVEDWNMFFDLPTYGNPFTSVEIVNNEVRLFGGSDIEVKTGLMYDYTYNTFLVSIIDEAGRIISVEGDAFSYSLGLISIDLPACKFLYGYDTSPFNDGGAFAYCDNLISVSMQSLESMIGYGCFEDCNALTTINFPSLTTAGYLSFSACTSLTAINLPVLTTAGNACFQGCTALTNINLPLCTDLGETVEDDGVFSVISGNTITATFNSALETNNSGSPDGDIQELESNNTVTITYV